MKVDIFYLNLLIWITNTDTLIKSKDLNKSQTLISDIERNKNLKKLIDKSFSLEATTRTEPNNYLTVSDELIEDNLREKIELESKSYLGVPK